MIETIAAVALLTINFGVMLGAVTRQHHRL